MNAPQLNILLLALGGLQGIFLFLSLLKKRKAVPGFVFLAAYLCVMLLQISLKVADKLWLMNNLHPLYSFSYQLPFLYGPLLYLFVCRFTNYRQPVTRDVLHFLPGIAFISLFIFSNPYQSVPAVFIPLFRTSWAMVLQLISLVVYHVLALNMLNKQNIAVVSGSGTIIKIQMQWLRQLVISSLVVCSVIAVVIYLMFYNYPNWSNVRFGFVALSFFIYWISYKAWNQPELFSVIHGQDDQQFNLHVPAFSIHLPAKKYSNSGLYEDAMQNIITALENKMRHDKFYLEPELTIDELAISLSCSRHHLSQALNEKLGKSFYDCINHYRVEEAKTLLTDPVRSSHKIASIAYDSGFNSISTFNDVFKKLSGLTPSQYRKQQEAKKLHRERV